MPLFNPEFVIKEKPISKHPWEHRIKAKYSGTYKYSHNSVENPIYPPTKTEDAKALKFVVIGNRVTKEFIYCLHLLKGLHKYRKKEFAAPVIRGVSSVEWPKVWNDLKIQFGETVYCIKSQVVILLNNEIFGGEQELKELLEKKYIYNHPKYLDYHKEGIKQFSNYVASSGRPFAYFQISVNDEPIGPLIFMLYADIAPLTCQNFIKLCQLTKGGYAGTPIHRIVKDSWVQCGGFGIKNTTEMDCENYIVPHDRRGVLGMANAGRNKDCTTQFFILLQPAPWMKHKYVAFGQLIEGEQTLKKIENVPTWYESPTASINIYKAGVFNLECQWRPVNKTATEYVFGHVEDLVALGQLFYQALLENVFAVLDEKRKAEEELLNAMDKDEEKKLQSHMSFDENFDFDVEEYYEYEYKEEMSIQQISAVLPDESPKSSQVIEKPLYLPLQDVPYPGEVESAFNLQRLLKGDYCLECDLIKDKRERQKLFTKTEMIAVPNDLLRTLFDFEEMDINISELSLDSYQDQEIRTYIEENVDSTSFAGAVIKKIANFGAKLDIFEHPDEKPKKYTDEDLRLYRVIAKEVKSAGHKKVSIRRDAIVPSHTRINRRLTGFVREEDIDEYETFLEKLESGDLGEMTREATLSQVNRLHQFSTSRALLEDAPKARPSTLSRLFDDLSVGRIDKMPTLKEFKPLAERRDMARSNYLTNSPLSFLDDAQDNAYFPQNALQEQELLDTLNLQHGKKLTRKVSSDYANTLKPVDRETRNSLRAVEYAKQRPSMSVGEYKIKNQQYQDLLKASKDNTGFRKSMAKDASVSKLPAIPSRSKFLQDR